MVAPEPRFSRIATTIGDPTRARMLAALMGGEYLAAGELADAAGVTAQTASAHVERLLADELVVLRCQGRHRYFRLADAEVARILEALALVAERSAGFAKWERGAYRPLKVARTCYNHLAGELGVAMFDGLCACGTLEPAEGGFAVSAAGAGHFAALGFVPPPSAPTRDRHYAYACLDWSERRDHLAGTLASTLFDHCLERNWLRRREGTRAIELTPHGKRALQRWLEPSAQRRPS